MLVPARTTFALRCARCGRMEVVSVSRFDVRRNAPARVTCTCGRQVLTVGVKGDQVSLQVPCYLCDGTHFSYYSSKSFWGPDLKQVMCGETELQLGVFGGEESVTAHANPGATELDRLLEDEAFDDYFDHREVMYQALNRVHTLAGEGSVTCTCGSPRISIDLFPDCLELACEDCGSSRTIFASTEEDLKLLERVSRIEVGGDQPPQRKGHKK